MRNRVSFSYITTDMLRVWKNERAKWAIRGFMLDKCQASVLAIKYLITNGLDVIFWLDGRLTLSSG